MENTKANALNGLTNRTVLTNFGLEVSSYFGSKKIHTSKIDKIYKDF